MNHFHNAIFSGIQQKEFETLSKNWQKRVFPKSTVILNEGDRSDSFYLIDSGKVKVLLEDDQGKEVVLNVLGAGEYFGEMALIDDETRSATVIAMEDSTLTLISMQDFTRCMKQYPDIAARLLMGLIRRLRNATKKIGSLALMDVCGRVANMLLQLARKKDGLLIVEQKLTHKEIASVVGSSREMVGRIMREMIDSGYISIDRDKRIILHEKF